MRKDEILEKARAEKSDEMEQHFNDKSMFAIIIAMFVCFCVFSITRLVRDMPCEDYVAALDISIAAGHFYRYSKTKKAESLAIGICFGIAGIIFMAVYFAKFFGV